MLHLPRIRRALVAITLVVPLAAVLTATAPAHADAEALSWTITNPNTDGKFTAVSGLLTVKNKAGTTLFTCPSLKSTGSMHSGTSNWATLGKMETTAAATCTGPNGTIWNATGAMAGDSYLIANSYNAATGTTSITNGPNSTSLNIVFNRKDSTPPCGFFTRSTAMTYTNATSTLKTTTAVVKVGTSDNVPVCDGLLTTGDTITFATEYKVTPAIKITGPTN